MLTLTEFAKKNSETIYPEDVILELILGAAKHNSGNFPKKKSEVHRIFFELKNKDPELLEFLIFNMFGLYPYSSELDEMIFELEASHYISTDNPSYSKSKVISNHDDGKRNWDSYIKDGNNRIAQGIKYLKEQIGAQCD